MGNSNNKDVKIGTHNVAKQAPSATAQTSHIEVGKIVTCNVAKQAPSATAQTSDNKVVKIITCNVAKQTRSAKIQTLNNKDAKIVTRNVAKQTPSAKIQTSNNKDAKVVTRNVAKQTPSAKIQTSNNKDAKIVTRNVAKQTPSAKIQTSNNKDAKIVTRNVEKQTPDTKTQTTNSTVWKRSSASIISSVKPPQAFLTEEEFFQKWSSWRTDFLIYRKILNDEKPDHGNGGDTLLNLMGPIGQEIYKRFTFIYSDNRKDLDILLTKFDQYCAFEGRKKKVQEDIYMYIHDLQLKAKEGNTENAEELIRKKILKEIDEYMFTNAVKRLIPSFQLSSDFNKLTLKEIAFIWKSYDQNSAQNCYRCGSNHSNETCPALGKQCSKCKELNHFRQRCPLIFLSDCLYCGEAHFKKQCPAYNEICTKCKKLNHFSWKCQSAQILQCQFCGLTHAASKALCPAINTFCIFCKTTGHFASKCKKKAHSNKH